MILTLNHLLLRAPQPPSQPPLLLIHGLFGSLDNLGQLARALNPQRDVLLVDLRNHGQSPHTPEMNYDLLAEDLIALIDAYGLAPLDIIGHSMGGKAAMRLAALAPQRLRRLVVLDMAPVAYPTRRHDAVFAALNAVQTAAVQTRPQAAQILRRFLQQEGVVQFLLKSFYQGRWRFNLAALQQHYPQILGWQPQAPHPGATLFIKGADSPYILDDYREAIARQFPCARAHVVSGSGHWLHAEQPDNVLRAVRRFLDPPSGAGA
ncbi:2-succinyl-6-hydroxy-2,4-cyclohexadiene-1-carboxy late synthase MenH and related esterases, alpha/beta hydrolase fold [Edwardsiella anguillarum]|uniref:Esterase ybfF n=2 Tax=Edwardsiella anguillarum TaxID=1821960 RepID=A0A076LGC8_9GAMM|nr:MULTISPECIES: alpha/beta fold hydrolase [Edwardsiella]AKM47191.1 acyl-CoA esterase [Edwardsiella sp. EA181011]GAJ68977.1 protein Esterase YbfF [Edwardsiella piscicida]AIJ07176.1 Esterase ybfF [Edwardsiella anguillarum ET080813]KAB0590969.1 alpha/beta fold hydrolase [Edwardsiella anguillarum]RFT03628.1 alpha/beta hydrolase [Edwardsiella anguillarum]